MSFALARACTRESHAMQPLRIRLWFVVRPTLGRPDARFITVWRHPETGDARRRQQNDGDI